MRKYYLPQWNNTIKSKIHLYLPSRLWSPETIDTSRGYTFLCPQQVWYTGEGNGKPLQYSCLENPMNSMKRQNDRIPKEELPRSLGAQYATGDQRRNKYRKNEGMEPQQKQYPVVDVTGYGSKVPCCKEQYCIGTWNVRSMNQALQRSPEIQAAVNILLH